MADVDIVTPVYFVMAFYVVAMCVVGYFANRQNAAEEEKAGDEGAVKTHFLGGKNFGVVVLTLTSLASVYSGFTVVGVPNEAGKNGYTTFRWVGIVIMVGISMSIVNPRLRRLSVVRDYESPGDFIMDRYNSIGMKCVACFCMCAPQILYLAVQFHALTSLIIFSTKADASSMPSFVSWVVVGIFLLLFFEVVGGMRSVAYTDSVQGLIMCLAFLAVPVTILSEYGGFGGQIANGGSVCEATVRNATMGVGAITNAITKPGYGCINYLNGEIITQKKQFLGDNYFLRTPSFVNNINDLNFYIGGIAFAIHPHIIQRTLSAKSDADLKFVARTIYASPWFAFPGMILVGMTATARKMTYSVGNQNIPAVFFAFVNEWRLDESVYKNFMGYLIILAAIAGIMSTADSCLIGVSNTVSVDIYRGWYRPQASGKQTIMFGKLVSLITALLSGFVAIYLHAEELRSGKKAVLNYGTLLAFQNGILIQGLPSFAFGLWTSISSLGVLTGAVSGLVVALTLMLVQAVANTNDSVDKIWTNLHPDYASFDPSIDPLVGAFVNICVCFLFLLIEKRQKAVEAKNEEVSFGGLSHRHILKTMNGMIEPFTYKGGIFLWITAGFLALSFVPRLDTPELAGTVRLNGKVNKIIWGLPSWVFWNLVMLIFATMFGIFGTHQWEAGDENNAVDLADGYTTLVDGEDADVELARHKNSWAGNDA